MFLGHFAVGLAAKRVAPRTSLGTLFAAAQLLDLVWPVLVLTGAEEVRIAPGDTAFTPLAFVSYPWSHSLLLVAGWATLFAMAYGWRTRYWRGTVVVAGLVLSHWILDLVTHRPDLPLAPGAVQVGLGLWRWVWATILLEGTLFVAGLYLYATGTRARNRAGSVGLVALMILLVAIYVANVTGPPPPSPTAVALAGLGMWLFIPWAAWADRNRDPIPTLPARGAALGGG